jgi:ferrochelatase
MGLACRMFPMSTAILLLAHGTPERADQAREYMGYITGGRPVPDSVIEEVAHRYGLIGSSPLTAITRAQSEALAKSLGMPVYFGMRNWHPFIKDVVPKMREDGVTRVIAMCLAPQNSRTSVGLYKKALHDAIEGQPLDVTFIDAWSNEQQLAQAFAEQLNAALETAVKANGKDVPVLFTAHSVPCRTIQSNSGQSNNGQSNNGQSQQKQTQVGNTTGDPYSEQCKHTAEMVAALVPRLKNKEWFFAFQSQGMSGGPWIGPTVEDTLTGIAALGHKAVVLQPIGFVCDHVEVLYDIDIAFKGFAAEKGMQLTRAASLNDSPGFIQALANVVKQNL